ncbi:MAG: tetratricopeptide repeat protein [Candidatus Omnitrophica bacterium]|nr:tetratricopeptide repeat protein [Candidatus Omnitrophota bacterium]
MRKISYFIIIVFIFCGTAFAQPPEHIYRKANLNYENEAYEEAVSLYDELVKMDRVSPEVFYNLGNSYFKLKKIGKAIVNYERALEAAPGDREIISNLKLAQAGIVDKIEAPERGFILDMILFGYDRMDVNQLISVSSFFYLSIIALLIFSIFFPAQRKTFFYTSGMAALALAIFLIFLFSKIHSETVVTHAVVVIDKVDVRSGPKQDYLLQFTIHEGTKVKVVKELKDWFEIDLSKGLRGWLPKDSVEII